MRSIKRFVSFFFVLGLICWGNAHAAVSIPERPAGYVNDYANALTPWQIAQLSDYLSDYEKATSNQIVVAIFSSLEGDPIEDFSIRLAEKWKIGRSGKDNGAILLVALNDHKVRIEVGYGLEGKLTDAASGEIIRNEIVPYFRQNQYFLGIGKALQDITEKIEGKPFGLVNFGPWSGRKRPSTGPSPGMYIGFFFLLLLFILFPRAAVPLILLGNLGGRDSSDSGGGFFGGGGGGSFGGGGASGSW